MNAEPTSAKPSGGVQSLHRAFDLLEVIADAGGCLAMRDIAAAAALPLPTIHRLLRTLVERGYVRQLPNREYALGYRLIPLGDAARRLVGLNADDLLSELVDQTGETANLAVLVGEYAEYVAQVPSRHSMRMFTEVGRRVELHCTGVGKALLAQLDDEQARAIVCHKDLATHTPYTIADAKQLLAELARIRDRGYALDEQEREIGVRCVAVPVSGPDGAWAAVSVSGPVTRMTDDLVERAVPLLRATAERLVPGGLY